MRDVVVEGKKYKNIYAVVKGKRKLYLLMKQTGSETIIHRPILHEEIIKKEFRSLYYDKVIDSMVTYHQSLFNPYYKGLKWVAFIIEKESDFEILPIQNDETISKLKEEIKIF